MGERDTGILNSLIIIILHTKLRYYTLINSHNIVSCDSQTHHVWVQRSHSTSTYINLNCLNVFSIILWARVRISSQFILYDCPLSSMSKLWTMNMSWGWASVELLRSSAAPQLRDLRVRAVSAHCSV